MLTLADRLDDCLGRLSLRAAAVSVVLRLPAPPSGLLSRALACLSGLDGLMWSLCYQDAISVECVRALLRHEDSKIAGSVATALWHRSPTGEIDPRLQAEWRDAVVRCLDAPPGVMLRFDPDLARDWLAARIRDRPLSLWHHGAAHEALGMLTARQRADLLRQVPEEHWGAEAVQMLVGDDLELYSLILDEYRLRQHHLVPLRGRPGEGWVAKAVLALDAGYSCEQVAWAAHGGVHSWNGSQSAMWEEWWRSYSSLVSHPDPRIRRVGEIGRERAEARRERAEREERHEAIHGERG